MGEVVLILGGARSGKSSFAQSLAAELGGDDVVFVATAEAGDAEMRHRIEAHRRQRPARWRTVEAPRDVGRAIAAVDPAPMVLVVDCLTLLVSNVMLGFGENPDNAAAEAAVLAAANDLLAACRRGGATAIVVTNEVGMGLVPPYPLGRLYRDLLGRANQVVAAQAGRVYFMLAGLAMEVRPRHPG